MSFTALFPTCRPYDDGAGRVLVIGDVLQLLERLPAGFADLFLTDPPYSSGGAFRGDRAQSTSSKYRMTGTVKTDPEFAGNTRDQRSYERWTVYWSNLALNRTRPGGALVCFTDWRQLGATADAIQVGGWVMRGISVWDKTEGTRPQLGWFRQQAEFMVTATRGPISRGKPGDGVASPGVFRQFMNGRAKLHITQKPPQVLAQVIATRPDWQSVVDPSGGAALTLVAARHREQQRKVLRQAFARSNVKQPHAKAQSSQRVSASKLCAFAPLREISGPSPSGSPHAGGLATWFVDT